MNKTQIVAAIAEKLGVSKRLSSDMVNCFIETVVEGVVKHGEVRIQGYGTMKKVHRAARMGVNPQNPTEKMQIPATKSVSFKASSVFKAAVKKS